MPEQKYAIELTRHELAHVVSGLQVSIKRRKDALRKAQAREKKTGRSAPGNVAGRCMAIADLERTSERLLKMWQGDAPKEGSDG